MAASYSNSIALQVSHTLLQLIDKKTGQLMINPHERMAVFVTNLRSALPSSFGWLPSIDSRIPLTFLRATRTGRGVLYFSRLVPHPHTFYNLAFTAVFMKV